MKMIYFIVILSGLFFSELGLTKDQCNKIPSNAPFRPGNCGESKVFPLKLLPVGNLTIKIDREFFHAAVNLFYGENHEECFKLKIALGYPEKLI